jgi:hypothetical protein
MMYCRQAVFVTRTTIILQGGQAGSHECTCADR